MRHGTEARSVEFPDALLDADRARAEQLPSELPAPENTQLSPLDGG